MPQFENKQQLHDFLKDEDQNEEEVLFDVMRSTTQNAATADFKNELADSSVAAKEAAKKAAAEQAAKKAAADKVA